MQPKRAETLPQGSPNDTPELVPAIVIEPELTVKTNITFIRADSESHAKDPTTRHWNTPKGKVESTPPPREGAASDERTVSDYEGDSGLD